MASERSIVRVCDAEKVTWMWNDVNPAAKYNPLRWSKEEPPLIAILGLEKHRSKERPVLLRVRFHGQESSDKVFGTPADAIKALERPLQEQSIAGLPEDLCQEAAECSAQVYKDAEKEGDSSFIERDMGAAYTMYIRKVRESCTLFVTVRGTTNLFDWLKNVNFVATSDDLFQTYDTEVHSTYWIEAKAIMDDLPQKIVEALRKEDIQQLVFTGHSFGGGVAMLLHSGFFACVQKSPEKLDEKMKRLLKGCKCIVFAAPMVFAPHARFGENPLMRHMMSSCVNYMLEDDLVPRFYSMVDVRSLLQKFGADVYRLTRHTGKGVGTMAQIGLGCGAVAFGLTPIGISVGTLMAMSATKQAITGKNCFESLATQIPNIAVFLEKHIQLLSVDSVRCKYVHWCNARVFRALSPNLPWYATTVVEMSNVKKYHGMALYLDTIKKSHSKWRVQSCIDIWPNKDEHPIYWIDPEVDQWNEVRNFFEKTSCVDIHAEFATRNNDGYTVLHLAAASKDSGTDTIKWLLEKKASPDLLTYAGSSPVDMALDSYADLLNKGSTEYKQYVLTSAKERDWHTVFQILQAHPTGYANCKLVSTEGHVHNLLHVAMLEGRSVDPEMAQEEIGRLISMGARLTKNFTDAESDEVRKALELEPKDEIFTVPSDEELQHKFLDFAKFGLYFEMFQMLKEDPNLITIKSINGTERWSATMQVIYNRASEGTLRALLEFYSKYSFFYDLAKLEKDLATVSSTTICNRFGKSTPRLEYVKAAAICLGADATEVGEACSIGDVERLMYEYESSHVEKLIEFAENFAESELKRISSMG